MQINEKSKYLIVGLVVLIALFILAFGMLFLNEEDPREVKKTYFIIFDQVSTLSEGDPVKINGVKLGKVSSVNLWGRKVRVGIEVREDVEIPVDSRVKVQNIGLMGERQIGVLLGDSEENLKDGDTVNGKFDAGIAEAMGVVGEVFDSTKVILDQVKEIMDSTIAKPEFKDAFNSILDKAISLENQVDTLILKTDPLISQSFKKLNALSSRLNQYLNDLEQPVFDLVSKADTVGTKAVDLIDKLDKLSSDLNAITQKLQNSDNTVGAMLNDDQLYTELRRTLSLADSLFERIIRDGLDVNLDLF